MYMAIGVVRNGKEKSYIGAKLLYFTGIRSLLT